MGTNFAPLVAGELVPIGILTTCLYNLVPTQIKCQINRSALHIHLDKPMHDIFRVSEVKKRVSGVKCKVRRAFTIESSINKTDKFIFNQITR